MGYTRQLCFFEKRFWILEDMTNRLLDPKIMNFGIDAQLKALNLSTPPNPYYGIICTIMVFLANTCLSRNSTLAGSVSGLYAACYLMPLKMNSKGCAGFSWGEREMC